MVIDVHVTKGGICPQEVVEFVPSGSDYQVLCYTPRTQFFIACTLLQSGTITIVAITASIERRVGAHYITFLVVFTSSEHKQMVEDQLDHH